MRMQQCFDYIGEEHFRALSNLSNSYDISTKVCVCVRLIDVMGTIYVYIYTVTRFICQVLLVA